MTPTAGAYVTTLRPSLLFDTRFLIPPADVPDFLRRDRDYDRARPRPALAASAPPAAPSSGPDPNPKPGPDETTDRTKSAGAEGGEGALEPPLQNRRRNIRDYRPGF